MPAGTYNAHWQYAQAARADEDFLVVYRYEWVGEGDTLGPFGQRHLERMLERLPDCPGSIIVESSGDGELDQRRVVAIHTALAEKDPAWSELAVVVGRSDAEPLYGIESQRVTRGFGGGFGGGQGAGGFGGSSSGTQGGGFGF